jgi:hypothetical protein
MNILLPGNLIDILNIIGYKEYDKERITGNKYEVIGSRRKKYI